MRQLKTTFYRPGYLVSILAIVVGFFFATIGVFAIYVNGLESMWYFGTMILFALVVGVYSGITNLTLRVVVTEQGVAKSYWYGTSFCISWSDIESWSIGSLTSLDSDDYKTVDFHLHGGGKVIRVLDFDVDVPGFEQFVNEVRNSVGIKEKKMRPIK